jgi:hypothetical protein
VKRSATLPLPSKSCRSEPENRTGLRDNPGVYDTLADLVVNGSNSAGLAPEIAMRYGSTGGGIDYGFTQETLMQAVGLVNDHLATCAFRGKIAQ